LSLDENKNLNNQIRYCYLILYLGKHLHSPLSRLGIQACTRVALSELRYTS
jgi:hypothetical protein